MPLLPVVCRRRAMWHLWHNPARWRWRSQISRRRKNLFFPDVSIGNKWIFRNRNAGIFGKRRRHCRDWMYLEGIKDGRKIFADCQSSRENKNQSWFWKREKMNVRKKPSRPHRGTRRQWWNYERRICQSGDFARAWFGRIFQFNWLYFA